MQWLAARDALPRINPMSACSYLPQLDLGEAGSCTPPLDLDTPVGVGIAVELLGSDVRGSHLADGRM
jgi:hypothetical protein